MRHPIKAFNQLERPYLEKILSDEIWLEGERRGCPVHRNDPVIQLRVAEIILNEVGAILRREIEGRN